MVPWPVVLTDLDLVTELTAVSMAESAIETTVVLAAATTDLISEPKPKSKPEPDTSP